MSREPMETREREGQGQGDVTAPRVPLADARTWLLAALGRRHPRWRAAIRSALPLAAVALVLVLTAWVYYVRFDFAHRPWGTGLGRRDAPVPIWLAFNDLGTAHAVRAGDQADAVAVTGYDGQYYYYLAQNPGVLLDCAQSQAHCPIDGAALRGQRIFYPMTAWLLALGNAQVLHFMLFAINFAAILLTALLVGLLCVEAGASRWLGAAAAIYFGELEGLLRDLADPYAVLWAVLAVYLLRKKRPLWCAAAVGAALLTREQLALALPLLVLPLLVQRRWGTAAIFLGIALGPFAVWQGVLKAVLGETGLQASMATTRGVHLPFAGLWAQRGTVDFGDMVIFVAIPLVAAAVVALVWMWPHLRQLWQRVRRQQGSLLSPRTLAVLKPLTPLLADPVALFVLVNAALATLTAAHEWEGTWASARLVAPVVVLGMVVAAELAAPLRRSYAALVAVTALATLMIPPLLL
ncbi:MAG TPA: hypothetical protein VJQ45_07225 [Ktedonobacterales bacterium]|nr:hypothetical protein [Ktedonobacterales bacterium]